MNNIEEYKISLTQEQSVELFKNTLNKFEIRGEGLCLLKIAIKNVLSEREQDKKRIKELEEERQLVGMPVKNKRDGRIGVVLHQWESGSVAVLENINPRIINTHDNWSTLEILTDEVKQTQIKCDSIPVQKVKDLIENETINISGFECIAVEDLEELLEEK